MKKSLLTLVLCSFAFGLGFGFNNIAFSNVAASKVAYVDVTKLLSASKALKSAEDARTKQTQEMLKWYDSASADIQKVIFFKQSPIPGGCLFFSTRNNAPRIRAHYPQNIKAKENRNAIKG